jgi:hypothetical protein
MSFQNFHILNIQTLFQKLSRVGENNDDETCANFIKQNTQQKARKKGTKKEDPNVSQKSKTKSESLKDKGTNHVSKPLVVVRSILKRERDEKLEIVIFLKKFSLAMTMHFKIEPF